MPEARGPDFRGKTVLVTGGTKGIGRGIGLAFGALGADCVLTYKWGSADVDELLQAYAAAAAPPPLLVRADASSDEDTAALFEQIGARAQAVDAIVSNVSFSFATSSLGDYRRRSLMKSMEYSAWPIVSYAQSAVARFGRPPRYMVGVSSRGPDAYHPHYDFVASAKAVMEVFARYLGYRLRDFDTRFNVVRPGGVFTDSLSNTFGGDFMEFALRVSDRSHYLTGDEVAPTVVALCSGWLDGVAGQVIAVDRGTSFFNDAMRLFEERERYGL